MQLQVDVGIVILTLVYLTKAVPIKKPPNPYGISLIHTGNHNIYNMFWKVSQNNDESCLFIVEADVDKYGKIQDHGLYVLNNFDIKKVRESGRDGVMATDGSNLMLVGTKNGIYRCDCSSCEQERYGSTNDSIIGIVMEHKTAKIYTLNEDKQLYAITEQGNKVSIDDRVQNALQIMIDCDDNLYYYGTDKQPYVISNNSTKKINGIPANSVNVKLLRPILAKSVSKTEAVMAMTVDNKIYGILPDATAVLSNLTFIDSNFPLVNIESPMIMFFAKEKEVYIFSPLGAIFQGLIDKWAKRQN